MRAFVAVTDRDWFEFLRARPDLQEVNFWQPSGGRRFRALDPGEMFLFKLHAPWNTIVGGGMYQLVEPLPLHHRLGGIRRGERRGDHRRHAGADSSIHP